MTKQPADVNHNNLFIQVKTEPAPLLAVAQVLYPQDCISTVKHKLEPVCIFRNNTGTVLYHR